MSKPTAHGKARRFDSLEQEAFLSLWRTYDRLRALEDELFARHDLTAQQYNALRLLRGSLPEKVPTLVLAGRLISRAPDITRLLDRLEQRGLIARERRADNRRVVHVGITDAGLALLRDLDGEVKACNSRQLGHLNADELRRLIDLLRTAALHTRIHLACGPDFERGNAMTATLPPTCADVVVIGGGPSGATASTLIAQRGHTVQLFERDHFPRFHIGESLIPETYWVLKRLNMLDKLRQSHFTKKYSVQFVGQNGQVSEPFYFHDNKPHECSQTWQVLRSEFDKMMLDNAREQGVQAHEGVRVLDVLFDGDRAVGVRVLHEDGGVQEVHSRVVVDASGQSSMIANRFKLKVWDPVLKKGALWTYFKGAYRDTGRNEGATMVMQTKGKKGWFWYIPLHDDTISVGVVAPFEYLFDKERGDYPKIYGEELENCPECKRRVSMGKQCAPFYATKDYSYRARKVAGDGWVLVGDAFGFLDPLYSSGVLLALKSGQLAADAIVEGLAKNDTSEAQLRRWEPGFVQGVDRMRRLVCEYYDGFSFGRFVKKHPHFKGTLTDLLVGDLFRDEVDVVVPHMDEIRKECGLSDRIPAAIE